MALPERPGGWGFDYERLLEWLADRYGPPSGDRWRILGLTVYSREAEDAAACRATWGGDLT